MRAFVENIGRRTVAGIEELGYVFVLLCESIVWLFSGKVRGQPVSVAAIFQEAMRIGINAVPIISLLCLAVGIMLAIQSIVTLRQFGAQSEVVLGIAIAVTREFAPLIVGVMVTGRSGSAITARIATMQENQEIDALRVIGINPVRYLAAPILVAMCVMVPALTVLGDFMGILGGALYTSAALHITLSAYFSASLESLAVGDISQGIIKSLVFAVIIVLVGLSNGFQVRGGAEGVGLATTRSVVLSICFIVLADMLFTYFLSR
jgi:phospholipid/cholesterol/gamma-HCH transport system permease protein